MIQCEKCEEWFHYECLGFLGTELDASIIDFICQKCIAKEKLETIKNLKEQYSTLFQYYKFPKQILYQLDNCKQKKAKGNEVNIPGKKITKIPSVVIYIKNKKIVTRDQFRKKGKNKWDSKKRKQLSHQKQIDINQEEELNLQEKEKKDIVNIQEELHSEEQILDQQQQLESLEQEKEEKQNEEQKQNIEEEEEKEVKPNSEEGNQAKAIEIDQN